MSEFAEDLGQLRLQPRPALSDDAFVARVMQRLDQPPHERRFPRRSSLGWALGAVAAAAAALVARSWPSHEADPPTAGGKVTARGSEPLGHGATVQAFVGRAAAGGAAALLEGAELGPGDGILVRYSNPGASELFLMVFALDAQRDVHWLHPAYLDDKTNPASLSLQPRVMGRALDEVAEPENPAAGELHVYALLSARPLHVKDVEAKLAHSRAPVYDSFPEAEVEEWRCSWRAR